MVGNEFHNAEPIVCSTAQNRALSRRIALDTTVGVAFSKFITFFIILTQQPFSTSAV
jgi:hypothetical protein